MSKSIEHTFDVLDGTCTVTSNESGNYLWVTFNGIEIEESSGECISWPDMSHLHGAALKAAENKVLMKAGEAAIASYIEFATEELARLKDEVGE